MAVVDVRYEEDYAVLVCRTQSGKEFETKVDVEDVENLRPFNWYQNAYGYLVARDPADPRPGPNLHMQRVVMKASRGEVIDHEFGDPLDNRKRFLRRTDRRGNGHHRVRLSRKNISGRTGVGRNPDGTRWVARLKVNRQTLHLGTFDEFDDAVAARVAAEKIHCGEFAPRT